MSYFSNFPLVPYIVDQDNAKIVRAKNILVRAKFSDYLKTNNAILTSYRIREEDRPDTIANTVYGRPDLHWIVLMFNDIINPYHDWPLTQANLEEFVNLVYPGTTLYVRENSIQSDGKALTPTTPFFEEGSTITQGSVSATVMSYNSTMGQLIVDNITGGEFQVSYTDNGAVKLGVQITQTNSEGNTITALITKKELTPYAVHHFEDDNGIWLDPRCKNAPAVGATISLTYRPFVNIPKSLINLYADPTIDGAGSASDESLAVARQVVTNMDYEYTKNEAKREIKILQPSFLDDILKQFADLFKKR